MRWELARQLPEVLLLAQLLRPPQLAVALLSRVEWLQERLVMH